VNKLPVLGLILIPLFATIYAVYLAIVGDVHASDIIMLVAGVILTEWGIGAGYHRLVVHSAYEPKPFMKAIVLAFGSMAFQGPVVNWASVHTKHHAHSDHEGDPHSPSLDGFIHAHFEWLLEMNSDDLDAIKAKWGERYMRDPMTNWFSNTFLFWGLLSLAIPAAIGFLVGGWPLAWTGFIWGGLVRIFVTSHVTWSVNSVCHFMGSKMFRTTDRSRNNILIGLLALGEGWHNNHHAFPSSAFHGLAWWQFDFTGLTIAFMEKVGLAKKVVRVAPALLENRRIKPGEDPDAKPEVNVSGKKDLRPHPHEV